MKRLYGSRGFTLIEAILIMVVVGASFFGFGYLFGNLSQEALQADITILATKLAREKMEEVIQTKADGGAGGYGAVSNESPTSVSSGTWSFTRSVATSYVDSDLNPSGANLGLKKVEVEVSWGGGGGESITLTTLVADVVPSAVSGVGGFSSCP